MRALMVILWCFCCTFFFWYWILQAFPLKENAQRKKIPKYIVLKESRFSRRFHGRKINPYTLVFASYCSFRKQFFKQNFQNPIYPNFCYLLRFKQQFFQKIAKIFVSGEFVVENMKKYPQFFRRLWRISLVLKLSSKKVHVD